MNRFAVSSDSLQKYSLTITASCQIDFSMVPSLLPERPAAGASTKRISKSLAIHPQYIAPGWLATLRFGGR